MYFQILIYICRCDRSRPCLQELNFGNKTVYKFSYSHFYTVTTHQLRLNFYIKAFSRVTSKDFPSPGFFTLFVRLKLVHIYYRNTNKNGKLQTINHHCTYICRKRCVYPPSNNIKYLCLCNIYLLACEQPLKISESNGKLK